MANRDIDERIEAALSAEDTALLERYAEEPGYFRQALGLFRGRLGWVMWFVYIVQFVLFLGAVYALYRMFTVGALMPALHWGVGAVILVQLTIFLRGFMGVHFEANRLLRELKRLELRLVRLEDGENGQKTRDRAGPQG